MFHYSEMLPVKQIQGRLWALATPDHRILLNSEHQPSPNIWSLLKMEIHVIIAGLTRHPVL